MNWFQAIILGIIQGLTEFLPVSSSGHLELSKFIFGINPEESFYFTIAVHGATVLSTLFVMWKEISSLAKGFFKFKMNDETIYVLKIILSMIPVGFVGLFFKDEVESLFNGKIVFVGFMLLLTSLLLALSHFIKRPERKITYLDSFIIGLSQALAVLPGLSRSGTTIATGLLLGNKKEDVAKFSFLMVLIPVLGVNILDMMKGDFSSGSLSPVIIASGFIAAFVTGYFACRWMITLVKQSKLIWFSIYCAIIGTIAILIG